MPEIRASAIQSRRRTLGLSQERLAFAAVIGKRSIRAIELGKPVLATFIDKANAALACLENGGTIDDARLASMAIVPPVGRPPCPHCGRPVERREREKKHVWLGRVACSSDCARALINAGTAPSNRERAESGGDWPTITGEMDLPPWAFRDDVRTHRYGRIDAVATHVATESTMGWAQR